MAKTNVAICITSQGNTTEQQEETNNWHMQQCIWTSMHYLELKKSNCEGTQNCEADLSEVEKTRMKRKNVLNKTKIIHVRGSRFKMLVENLIDEKIKKGNEYKVGGWCITY